ncbi:MAG TPA: outer membrane beta-barrel protein, partial [Verrucomicrobiae bacterium]|nr:outer membrane beta-barrel protein [Verrucomicrobiae bacterium]
YASFQATEKLSVTARGEYLWQSTFNGPLNTPDKVFALTGTIQYDLWKNVLSRLEVRWDHQAGSDAFTGTGAAYGGDINNGGAADKHNYYTLAANIIYKF